MYANPDVSYSDDPASEDYNLHVKGPVVYGMNITVIDQQIRTPTLSFVSVEDSTGGVTPGAVTDGSDAETDTTLTDSEPANPRCPPDCILATLNSGDRITLRVEVDSTRTSDFWR